MKHIIPLFFLSFFISCKTHIHLDKKVEIPVVTFTNSDFTIAFGSGNNQKKDNPFWNDLLQQQPSLWIWGGDNIYCDTEDMTILSKCYQVQKNKSDYQNFIKNTEVLGIWDDHDYGVNDGGKEYPKKEASQQLFLDFLDVPKDDSRRKQLGTYYSETYTIKNTKIKIILLDTRFFRSKLTKDYTSNKRYKPNTNKEGTLLGKTQWEWLEKELTNSDADYHIINSSIQFLSNQHGFEAWGNMPHEVEKLENLIVSSNAKDVIILSGDRHISEISMKNIGDKNYPLIDFTSSGLTHSYSSFTQEENPYRVSKVVFQKSYGLVKFDFKKHKIIFEMWGENNRLLESYSHTMQH